MHTELQLDPGELCERASELSTLAAILAVVTETGCGRLAVVHGEAGIGKTALLRRFSENVSGSARLLWGRCDELFTPSPLGPLFDIAGVVGGRLADVLQAGGTPHEVAAVLARTLTAHAPTIVVLEDVHLADEATLDVLRILGGRASELPALIVATYRDDALDRWHPLRLVLGDVATAAPIARLRLPRLSPGAVAQMAAGHGVFGEELYRKTAGNPFFVTEVLASDDGQIPETVREAVLGRVAGLSAGARRLIDAVAVARPDSELWLLRKLALEDIECLEEAVASGIVVGAAGKVSFRHELARLAVEESIPAHRREELHRQALEFLAEPPDGGPDPARLAHHAEAVGDGELVLRFAPLAAAQASALGAHREASVHYRRALQFDELAPVETRAWLSALCAQESFLVLQFPEAVAAQREALACFEQLGDRCRQGSTLTFLAQLLWNTGSLREALAAVTRGLALLEDAPGRELVGACCQMARLQLAAEDPAAALDWAERATLLAESIDDAEGRIEALQTVGWAELFTGTPGGLEKLVASLELATRAGVDWMATTACVIIVRTAGRRREYAIAEQYLRTGLEFCSLGDYDVWRYYLISWQSRFMLARGQWSEAAQRAQVCLADPCPFARIHALIALGTLRARRGDPDVWGPLDDALALAEPRDELQWLAPVAIARAEAAWLEGRAEDVIAATELANGQAAGTSWAAGLAYWRWRAGVREQIPDAGEEQYRLEIAGEWAAASESWRAIGCPYEAAFALLDGDEAGLLQGLGELRGLGASPAAKLAVARLREIGVRGVPRGPRSQTRTNPAGLTSRELEVLALLSDGLRNAQIAQSLVVSEKTVDHHVSAILRKLDVHTRGDASAKAERLGLTFPR